MHEWWEHIIQESDEDLDELGRLMSTASAVKRKFERSVQSWDTASGCEANYIPQRANASPGTTSGAPDGPDKSDRIVGELMRIS